MEHPRLFVRDLFWLAALMAMGLGWLVDRREKQEALEKERSAAKQWRETAIDILQHTHLKCEFCGAEQSPLEFETPARFIQRTQSEGWSSYGPPLCPTCFALSSRSREEQSEESP